MAAAFSGVVRLRNAPVGAAGLRLLQRRGAGRPLDGRNTARQAVRIAPSSGTTRRSVAGLGIDGQP